MYVSKINLSTALLKKGTEYPITTKISDFVAISFANFTVFSEVELSSQAKLNRSLKSSDPRSEF